LSFFDVHVLTELQRVSSVAPSPCGTWAAVAAQQLDDEGAKYKSALWRVSLTESVEPVRLTLGSHNDRAPCFRRDGVLGFLSDRPTEPSDDDEAKRSQVWILPATGEPRPLTDEPLGVDAFRFAPEADCLVVQAAVEVGVEADALRERAEDRDKNGPSVLHFTRMPVRHWDHWLGHTWTHLIAYDASGEARRDLTPDAERQLFECEWDLSRDGRRVVTTWGTPSEDRLDDIALMVIDIEDGHRTVLGADPGFTYYAPRIAPDGARVVCDSYERTSERCIDPTLHLFSVETGQERPLCADWVAWPTPLAWVPGAIVCAIEERGERAIYSVDPESEERVRLSTGRARGVFSSVVPYARADAKSRVPTADQLSFVAVRSRLTRPPEPVSLACGDATTFIALGDIAGSGAEGYAASVVIEELEATASDGAAIQYYFVRPRDDAHDSRGTLLWIHGGPMSQWVDGWHWRWNVLPFVSRGFSVALPNPRGSTGFGYDFTAGIWGNNYGSQCYDDVIAVANALAGRRDVDADRMGAMGGSFGGYMTNWIGANTDRFKALVTHASLYALGQFQRTTDHPSWKRLTAGFTPYDDPDEYDKYSPHRYLEGWKTPTLVVHGEKDYRVPITEGLALFEGLQMSRVPSEMVVFPDEGHWILKPRNIVAWYTKVIDFLERYL